MKDVSAEAWLTQEISDLLNMGPVGLYEFVWGLNGTSYGLTSEATIQLSRRVAERFVADGKAGIYAVRWPGLEIVEGPLPPAVLMDPLAWTEGESGPLLALVPS